MSKAALELERIACLRGGRLLFEDLSLSLAAGEAAIVTGANGVGKSSLLRIAAGLLPPSAGKVRRNGTVALADENGALVDRLALGAALAFWARLDGTDAGAGMEAMGLSRLSQVPVRMLSTGQRKRAVLARTISSGAPIWLLDEPGNGLDSEGQERLALAAASHLDAGGIVLAATHQPLGLGRARELRL